MFTQKRHRAEALQVEKEDHVLTTLDARAIVSRHRRSCPTSRELHPLRTYIYDLGIAHPAATSSTVALRHSGKRKDFITL